MKTILHIDSSVRRTDNSTPSYNSISKSFGRYFIDTWLNKNHQDKVVCRDLGLNPPTFICQDWIAAAFTPEQNRSESQQRVLAESDRYFDEVAQADIILITAPMYNYGMPAVLKAWFDQMLRVNKTFTFDLARGDFPIEPILSGKTLVLLTSAGEFGFGIGGVREQMNHLSPHIKELAKYLGVDKFYEIGSEYQEFADDRHVLSVEKAKQDIVALVNLLN
ncbi:ACP phosphodiesterase [Marinomonas rhizomae]|uniref:FMN dependent NADH:quinone oxidoreductase n=1 Tax=Marinomonas rhizomae TaxID=491948 RepID=A0A366IXN6_9GAMM|nr:NAD(P)H-dependent oxidoreductase [Marinomonas rhizomae]RBP79561.1 FMN-dependent NADH-azoreductase [Marinomonas rhizomae]RNF71565.1 ACP phosphodiesterase [Marinomonas rhizomae]